MLPIGKPISDVMALTRSRLRSQSPMLSASQPGDGSEFYGIEEGDEGGEADHALLEAPYT